MSEPSYFPKDGDFASLIDQLGQQQLREIEKQRLQSLVEHQKHSQQAPASYARLKPLHADTVKTDNIKYQNAVEQDRQHFAQTYAPSTPNSAINTNIQSQTNSKLRSQVFSGTQSAAQKSEKEHEGNMRTFRTIALFIILTCVFVLSEFELEDDFMVFLVCIIIFFLVAVFGSFRRKKTGA